MSGHMEKLYFVVERGKPGWGIDVWARTEDIARAKVVHMGLADKAWKLKATYLGQKRPMVL